MIADGFIKAPTKSPTNYLSPPPQSLLSGLQIEKRDTLFICVSDYTFPLLS